MSKKELYAIRSTDNPTQWRVLKVDFDFNPGDPPEYHISRTGAGYHLNCSCFAGNKEKCRHRTMLPVFEVDNKIDTNFWYNFDQQKWVEGPKQDG